MTTAGHHPRIACHILGSTNFVKKPELLILEKVGMEFQTYHLMPSNFITSIKMFFQDTSKDLVMEMHVNQLAYCPTCIKHLSVVLALFTLTITHLTPTYLFLFLPSAILIYFIEFLNTLFYFCIFAHVVPSSHNAFLSSATSLLLNIPFILQILIFLSIEDFPDSFKYCEVTLICAIIPKFLRNVSFLGRNFNSS